MNLIVTSDWSADAPGSFNYRPCAATGSPCAFAYRIRTDAGELLHEAYAPYDVATTNRNCLVGELYAVFQGLRWIKQNLQPTHVTLRIDLQGILNVVQGRTAWMQYWAPWPITWFCPPMKFRRLDTDYQWCHSASVIARQRRASYNGPETPTHLKQMWWHGLLSDVPENQRWPKKTKPQPKTISKRKQRRLRLKLAKKQGSQSTGSKPG